MATPNVNEIISWAKKKVGSNRWNGYCQKFVADACCVGGKYTRHSKETATLAYKAWCKSKSKTGVPAGAAVYFNGSNPKIGHVGLCIGNDQYIHAARGIKISNLSSARNYRGWGWNGNVKPSGAVDSSAESTSGTSGKKEETKTEEQKKNEITTVVVKSVTGNQGKQADYLSAISGSVLSEGIEILIQNDKIYQPMVEGDVTLESERKGRPATLKFNVVKDGLLNIQEGNPVSMHIKGTGVFYGYIFTKSRTDKRVISITCYDQMRYLKNKDSLVHSKKTYSELLRMIAADYGLKCGEIADTRYILPSRVEEDTLFDILGNASDLTVLNTGNLFVLYDDFGKLTLKNINEMKLPIMIDENVAAGYSYSTSIDKDVYNRIKTTWDNEETGVREAYVLNSEESQKKWGVLQYYENSKEASPQLLQEKAKVLLRYYNKKQRSLKINQCLGDLRVRGGCSVVVNMELGDMIAQNYMVVERVKHTFSHGQHLMDLTLSGIRGEFNV